jgi:hypothetical protein
MKIGDNGAHENVGREVLGREDAWIAITTGREDD